MVIALGRKKPKDPRKERAKLEKKLERRLRSIFMERGGLDPVISRVENELSSGRHLELYFPIPPVVREKMALVHDDGFYFGKSITELDRLSRHDAGAHEMLAKKIEHALSTGDVLFLVDQGNPLAWRKLLMDEFWSEIAEGERQGLSLDEFCKLATHDDIPETVRRRVQSEFAKVLATSWHFYTVRYIATNAPNILPDLREAAKQRLGGLPEGCVREPGTRKKK